MNVVCSCNPPIPTAGPWLRGTGRIAERAFTLLEVTIALGIFSVVAVGITAAYSKINQRATQVRCTTVADAILRAKVAKVLTDPWLLQTIPNDCTVTNGEVPVTKDPKDPYDVGAAITLITQSDSPQTGLVLGTLYRNTRVVEASSHTVAVDYRLAYIFRDQIYNSYASTVRARDQ